MLIFKSNSLIAPLSLNPAYYVSIKLHVLRVNNSSITPICAVDPPNLETNSSLLIGAKWT